MPRTDSAVSLLCGVHRRVVRNLTRLAATPAQQPQQGFTGVAAEVVARWLSDAAWLDRDEQPRPLSRNGESDSFAALVRSVSSDVRARAVLDELLRLGIASESGEQVSLLAAGFAPRQGFEEMTAQLQGNLHDHLAAACRNLEGQANFLEQSVYVDQITPQSVALLQKASVQGWRQAFRTVMREAQGRFDHDAVQASAPQRNQRVRFGVYFYSTEVNDDEDAN